jgi:hypothetical protein
MRTWLGLGLISALLWASGGCNKLDTFADAGIVEDGSPDHGTADAVRDADPKKALNTQWVKAFGDKSTTALVGEGIGVDAKGYVYFSAWLWGKVQIGQDSLGATDKEMQVLVKLDPQGKPVWARQAGPLDMSTSSGALVGPPFNLGFCLDPSSGSS